MDTVFVREWHWPPCPDNADPVAAGCIVPVRVDAGSSNRTTLLDMRTDQSNATSCTFCDHRLALWHLTPAATATQTVVLLGDLGKYVPKSGYRFRLPADGCGSAMDEPNGGALTLVVVGSPEEQVPITYLALRASAWRSFVTTVTIPTSGRTQVVLS